MSTRFLSTISSISAEGLDQNHLFSVGVSEVVLDPITFTGASLFSEPVTCILSIAGTYPENGEITSSNELVPIVKNGNEYTIESYDQVAIASTLATLVLTFSNSDVSGEFIITTTIQNGSTPVLSGIIEVYSYFALAVDVAYDPNTPLVFTPGQITDNPIDPSDIYTVTLSMDPAAGSLSQTTFTDTKDNVNAQLTDITFTPSAFYGADVIIGYAQQNDTLSEDQGGADLTLSGDIWVALPHYLNSGASASETINAISNIGNTWMAGLANGYASRSTDNGITWTAATRHLGTGGTGNLGVSGSGSTFLAYDNSGYASRSTNGGTSWSALIRYLSSGAPSGGIMFIVGDGAGTWVSGFNGGYSSRSVNDGLTWTALPRGLNHGGAVGWSLNSCATDGNGVWVAGFNDGYASRSIDNGATWSALPRYLNSGAQEAGEQGDIYAIETDGNGTWVQGQWRGYASKSIDNGLTWTTEPQNLGNGSVQSQLETISTDGNGNWMNGADGGFAGESIDNAMNWTAQVPGLNSGVTNQRINSIANNGNNWVAGFNSGWASIAINKY